MSFILPDDKSSPYEPEATFLYYMVGGHEYNNLPSYEAQVIQPMSSTEDTILPCVLSDDKWNGTAFTNGAKALLIKEWSI